MINKWTIDPFFSFFFFFGLRVVLWTVVFVSIFHVMGTTQWRHVHSLL